MNDDRLILFYYNDGLTAGERREVAAALQRDPALAARFRALAQDLDALRTPADAAMPPGLEYRLQSTLQRAARLEATETAPKRPGLHFWSFALGTALTAALALGIGIGLWWSPGAGPGPQIVTPPPNGAPAEWSTAAFQRGLEAHFRSGRTDLGGLDAQAGSDRAALVGELMERNRAYAQLAIKNGAPELARVLRSFEPILEQLGREDLSEEDAAALRAQLEFEFTVMLTKLARASSQEADPNNSEI